MDRLCSFYTSTQTASLASTWGDACGVLRNLCWSRARMRKGAGFRLPDFPQHHGAPHCTYGTSLKIPWIHSCSIAQDLQMSLGRYEEEEEQFCDDAYGDDQLGYIAQVNTDTYRIVIQRSISRTRAQKRTKVSQISACCTDTPFL
jgi:hypothetical protein